MAQWFLRPQIDWPPSDNANSWGFGTNTMIHALDARFQAREKVNF